MCSFSTEEEVLYSTSHIGVDSMICANHGIRPGSTDVRVLGPLAQHNFYEERKCFSFRERNLMFGSVVRQVNWTLYSTTTERSHGRTLSFIFPACLVVIVLNNIHLQSSSNALCRLRISHEISMNAIAIAITLEKVLKK